MELRGADSFDCLESTGRSKELGETVCKGKSGFQREGVRIEGKSVEASTAHIVGTAF